MPCKDITDTLEILVSPDDRVVEYSLRKKTCGGEVGSESLIAKWLRKRTVDQVLQTSAEDLIASHPGMSELREFLVVKHFLAVQAGLAVMLGHDAGSVDNYCTVDAIEQGPEGIRLTALIKVDGITSRIEACSGGCSNKKHSPNNIS